MNIPDANVTINVTDLDTSIAFYESIGFQLLKRWGNYYAQIKASGITIGLHPARTEDIAGNSGNVSIGFTSQNISETKNELEALSVKVTERTEEGGTFIHFNDPDGTALYFIKPNW